MRERRPMVVILCFLASEPVLVGCGSEAASHGAIPAPLAAIEGTAEDAYDRSLLGDFPAVLKDAESLSTTWSSFRLQAIQDGAREADAKSLDAAIAGLEAAASAGSPEAVPTARAANAVSRPMDELFGVYNPKVPPVVMALDFLGREVALDGLSDDPEAATPDLDAIEAVWSALRQAVVDAGGSKEAGDFDTSVEAARAAVAAGDAELVVNVANGQLEIVDAIEKVFDQSVSDDEPD